MKTKLQLWLFIIALTALSAIIIFVLISKTNRLQNELSALESRQSVKLITIIDSMKSAEFAFYEAELKKKDSIYNIQIIQLQNENKIYKTRYNRIFSDYADIVVERPRW